MVVRIMAQMCLKRTWPSGSTLGQIEMPRWQRVNTTQQPQTTATHNAQLMIYMLE